MRALRAPSLRTLSTGSGSHGLLAMPRSGSCAAQRAGELPNLWVAVQQYAAASSLPGLQTVWVLLVPADRSRQVPRLSGQSAHSMAAAGAYSRSIDYNDKLGGRCLQGSTTGWRVTSGQGFLLAVPLCSPNRRCARYLSASAIDRSAIARGGPGIAVACRVDIQHGRVLCGMD